MKNSLKALQEKYGNVEKENVLRLIRYMKRKRLEQGKTLENVSKGVCSPSYYSKIENGLVDVDDYYLKKLCENLNIEYDNVKCNRDDTFFSTVVEYYLLNRFDLLDDKLKRMVNAGVYCDTELELIILLTDILNKNFNEAFTLITKLEDIRNILSKEELYLLAFLSTLYLFKINQFKTAAEQIEILKNNPSDNMYFNIAVWDLGADIYFCLGKESTFFRYYQGLKQFDNQELYNNRILMHNLQCLVLYAKNGNVDVEDELDVQLLTIKNNDLDENKIVFYQGLIYYYLADYLRALDILNVAGPDYAILCLEAMVLSKINDFEKSGKYLRKIKKSAEHSDYEKLYVSYLEYMKGKFEQHSYLKMQGYLKSYVLPLGKKYGLFWLYEEEIREYLNLCFELGKYKEVVRFLIKNGDLDFLKKH
ncbi:MAG: helix-turn-helix transcriptional regulator [Bacilli bacterium]|nr:helix-turn-helix transcriptional regulator [Bacilli bacterium]